MIYNIALILNKKDNELIFNFYKNIKKNIEFEFEINKSSILHLTLLKFYSNRKLESSDLKDIFSNLNNDYIINIKKISALKNELGEYWIELSVNESKDIIDLHKYFLNKLKEFKILSRVDKDFRPHITLAKIKSDNSLFEINKLISNSINISNITVKLKIGISNPDFTLIN